MLITSVLSYVAGILTVLAPCVLPLLPIILGGSVTGVGQHKWRPYIIIASLVASLITFTIILKVSTSLLGIDPRVWSVISGGLVIALGLFMLLPSAWVVLNGRLGIEQRSQALLGKASRRSNGLVSAILTGAALGPVFSSCSPTYTWVIATVIPAHFVAGMFYLIVYCFGVATSLLIVALFGRRAIRRFSWATNPYGWFQKTIAVVFIIVGVFVATGLDKQVQTYLVQKDWLNLIQLEQGLVPEDY